MDEYVDILDNSGRPTGKTALKSEVHRKGLFHPTVHVWLYTANGMVLLQQRGKDKKTHPLLWDVSVAGHVSAGEEILTAAIREVREEVGLELRKDDLEKVGVFNEVHEHGEGLIDCEFHHTFICPLQVPFASLVKQDSEVEALKLVPLLALAEESWGLARPQKYVPHETGYYKAVFRAIQSRL